MAPEIRTATSGNPKPPARAVVGSALAPPMKRNKMTDTAFKDFDFMSDPVEEEPPLDQHPDRPKSGKAPMFTNKDLAQSILNVFDRVGHEDWLLKQAVLDPKSFLSMLSKMIPKSIDAEDLQGLTLILVDQYHHGDKVIHMPHDDDRSPALPASAALASERGRAAGGGPSELGLPASKFETATSGNPDVEVIDIFKGGEKRGS